MGRRARPGEDDRAEACYNAALAALPDPYTAEQLLKALNILIINFETAKFDLKDQSKFELTKLQKFLQSNPNTNVEIGGHTDNVGDKKANQLLSENRAKAVYDYLIKNGIMNIG